MRTLAIGICTVTVMVAVMAGTLLSQEGGSPRAAVTGAQLHKWTKELSNWGRWGKDDDLGTLNLITPAKRKQAAALVKEGISISLGADLNTQKGPGNPNPAVHVMHSREFDRIETDTHVGTHIDAESHRYSCWLPDGKELTTAGGACRPSAYNGYDPNEAVVMKGGHARFSINNLRNGVLTRGILMDIPRLKGVPYLKRGTKIYIEDLEAWEKKAGVKVSSGDALVIRTGIAAAPEGTGGGELDQSVLPWLKQRDIAVNLADTGSAHLPHFVAVNMGMINVHALRLEALSEALAARKRWEFMLTIVPLRIPGATASPVNPIATF